MGATSNGKSQGLKTENQGGEAMQQQAIEKVIEQAGVDTGNDELFGKALEEVLEYCQTADPIDDCDPSQWTDEDVGKVLAEKMGISDSVLHIILECRRDPELVRSLKALMDHYQKLEDEEPGSGLEFVKFVRDFAHACREAKAEVQHV